MSGIQEARGGKHAILQAGVSRIHTTDLEPHDPCRWGELGEAQRDFLSQTPRSVCTYPTLSMPRTSECVAPHRLAVYIGIQALRSAGRTASLLYSRPPRLL